MTSLLQTITTNQTTINSNTAAISDLQTDKQNVLIAGNNISIVNNVISSTGEGGTTDTTTTDNLQTQITTNESNIDINTVSILNLQTGKQDVITSTTDLNCQTINTTGNIVVGGIVSAPNQISFRAERLNNVTITANIVLPFDTIVSNIGNAYNNSTYIFTAPVNGTYLFITQFFTNGNNTYSVDFLKLAGSTETLLRRIERQATQAGDNRDIGGSVSAFLNSGEQVYLKKVGLNSVLLARTPFSFFGGCLL